MQSTISSLGSSEAKYRALFETNLIGIALSDLDNSIIDANDAFLDLVGYTQDDLANGKLTWSAISPQAYDALDDKKVKELLRRGTITPFEKAYLHKDGHLVPVLVGAETVQENPPLGVSFALDISHRKKMEQRKDDFIGTVSHELKSPLAVLKIYADLLRAAMHDGDQDEVLRNLDEIDNQVHKLNILIGDLTNLTRIQMDKGDVGRNLFNLADAVAAVVKDAKLTYQREILLKNSRKWYVTRGNREQLELVFRNLIANAVRYSADGTRVTVRVRSEQNHAVVSVEDRGIGIPPEEREAIFERYYRADHAASFSTEGMGIGLYVCKEILANHKGQIVVESSVGKGSRFSCFVPLVPERRARRIKHKGSGARDS